MLELCTPCKKGNSLSHIHPQHGVTLSPSPPNSTKTQCTPLHIVWSLVSVEAFEVLKFLYVLQSYYSEYLNLLTLNTSLMVVN